MNYPDAARCAVPDCGHKYKEHSFGKCFRCAVSVEPHEFVVTKFAGGAFTPADEKAAYERALRGEV